VAIAASHIDHELFRKCLNLSRFGVKDHAFFLLGGIVAKLAKLVLTPRENRARVRDYQGVLGGAGDSHNCSFLQLTQLELYIQEVHLLFIICHYFSSCSQSFGLPVGRKIIFCPII